MPENKDPLKKRKEFEKLEKELMDEIFGNSPTPKPKPIAAVIAHSNERPYWANIPSKLIGSNILPPCYKV